MSSLRVRLSTLLLLTTLVVSTLVGWVTFQMTLSQNEKLFDYQLKQMALSMRGKDASMEWEPEIYGNDAADSVAQIVGADGGIRYRSQPELDLPARLAPGFSDVRIDGVRWRAYSLPSGQRVLQVAQPWQIRRRLALDATLDSLAPMLAFAPIMAALIWWLIGREFRVLRRLESEVVTRRVNAMQPVSEQGLPSEIAPVAQALNLLLGRLAQAFDAQRAFISDAAHELRSPVTALKLQVEALEHEAAGRVPAPMLDELRQGVERMHRLIEQLLAAAASDPDELGNRFVEVDLPEEMRRTVADCFDDARQRRIALSFQGPESLPVCGEPELLRILMRNLLDNAIRYTPERGRIAITVRAQAAGALLVLDDSGPGIPEEERERVFQRFYRGHTAGQSGSGLGLAIVRAIAHRHGARVKLLPSRLGGLQAMVEFTRLSPPDAAA